MVQIAIGKAVGEGFSLIAGRPLTILLWGLARLMFAGVFFALMAPVYLALIGHLGDFAANGGAYQPDELAAFQSIEGTNLLLSIGGLFVGAVLYCAVFRSILFPEQDAWAYLRIGMAELFYFLFLFGGFIAVVVGLIVVMIPLFVMAVIAGMAHAAAIAATFIVAGYVGVLVLLLWVMCRASMVGPMIVEDSKFHLFDAWALTKGQVWRLLAIALLIFLILLAIEVVVGAAILAFGLTWFSRAIGGLANLHAFFQRPPVEVLSTLAPALVVASILSVPIWGCMIAIIAAPWARAYRDLRPPAREAVTV